MHVVKGTTPCFLKGLDNKWQAPLLFTLVFIILENYWKLEIPAKRENVSMIAEYTVNTVK